MSNFSVFCTEKKSRIILVNSENWVEKILIDWFAVIALQGWVHGGGGGAQSAQTYRDNTRLGNAEWAQRVREGATCMCAAR